MGSDVDVNIVELESKGLPSGAIYSEYLARWASWVARTWTDTKHGTDLRREVVLQVAPVFIPGHNSGLEAKMYGRFTRSSTMLMILE